MLTALSVCMAVIKTFETLFVTFSCLDFAFATVGASREAGAAETVIHIWVQPITKFSTFSAPIGCLSSNEQEVA